MSVKEFKVKIEDGQYEKLKSFAKESGCFMTDLIKKGIDVVIQIPRELSLEVLSQKAEIREMRAQKKQEKSTLNSTQEIAELRSDIKDMQSEQRELCKRVKELLHSFNQIQTFQKNLISCLFPLALASAEPTQVSNLEKDTIREILPLTEITIPPEFLAKPPRREGVQEVIEYYKTHGSFDMPVTVRKEDMLLVRGYKRYVAAEELGLEEIEVKFV